MNEMTLEVERRDSKGKNYSRRLRAAGQLPAVVYGGGKDPVAIQLERRQLEELLRAEGENAIFLLKLAGTEQSRHTMIREMQHNAVNGALFHVDFQRVDLDQKIRISVPIHLTGTPEGVKTENGLLDFVTREIEVFCLPGKIPSQIDIDVSELHVGQHVEAGELELPDEVELHMDAERVIASVAGKKGGPEDEEAEDEDELLEQVSAEPEVIKRGKDEGEG